MKSGLLKFFLEALISKAGRPCCVIKPKPIDGLSGSPGESQKEGREDQGEIKELGGATRGR